MRAHWRLALNIVLVGLVLWLMWWIGERAMHQTTIPTSCVAIPPATGPPDRPPAGVAIDGRFAAVTVCIALLLVGARAGFPRPGVDAGSAHEKAVLAGLLFFLLAVAAALAYETWAAASDNGHWAVTDYVHCANDIDPQATLAAACVLCVLFGQWLWRVNPPQESAWKRRLTESPPV